MKSNRNFGSFESTTTRRRRGLPIATLIPVVIVALIIGLILMIWSRGGEQPQKRVEKAIPAEQLGK
jgi:NADH:ubiquinone oxidoreductase subunit 6 (subunit J)